jgi:hypothetical protein
MKLLFASILTLCLMCVGAYAESLAKSGSGSIHTGFKATGITTTFGDKRVYWTGSYWGVSFNDEGKGLFQQAAWNCPAVADIQNDAMRARGSCTVTDADGDRFSGDWTGKGPVGAEFAGEVTVTNGTGKYAGMQGSWEFHCWGVGADDQLYCRQKYAYKLP